MIFTKNSKTAKLWFLEVIIDEKLNLSTYIASIKTQLETTYQQKRVFKYSIKNQYRPPNSVSPRIPLHHFFGFHTLINKSPSNIIHYKLCRILL